ncbi:class I SAM-dependent methyltransferase [Dactylosporangium sp. McL0621]|uniref:class I SAM-dependent methyltransferase n=1 Tax=Dactylosporangium sp. McL0621 TaxID=3415678 RepID=UPI003CF249E3
MIDMTTAKQRWLDSLWPFVRAHLPPAPSRVLEIGCGPAGGFVPAMRRSDYDAVGVDPAAPSGPGYHQTEFEKHQLGRPVDAIVACTSLHHVDDLDEVLNRAAAALTPGGAFIVVEWAYERFDEATARWSFDRLPDSGERGWLHSHREQWQASGQPWQSYLQDWAGRERLYRGEAIIQALQARFQSRLDTRAPYFFPDLHPVSQADEQAAIDAGEIRATGIHYVGTKRYPA